METETNPPAFGLVNSRVMWTGTTLEPLPTAGYQASQAGLDASRRRPPRPDELHELTSGHQGTAVRFDEVDEVGNHYYEIEWDNGTRISAPIPSPLVAVLPAKAADELGAAAGPPSPPAKRYAEYTPARRRPGWLPWRRRTTS